LWDIKLLEEYIEVDSFPLSKPRGRGSVHINHPRPLHEVELTSKWWQGFPQGKCEYVSLSKSEVEGTPRLSQMTK